LLLAHTSRHDLDALERIRKRLPIPRVRHFTTAATAL
jgi:hypothetical protein